MTNIQKQKYKILNVRLPIKMWEILRKHAYFEDTSLNKTILECIEMKFEKKLKNNNY